MTVTLLAVKEEEVARRRGEALAEGARGATIHRESHELHLLFLAPEFGGRISYSGWICRLTLNVQGDSRLV